MWAVSVMTLACALLAPAGSQGDEAVPPAGATRGAASSLAGQRQTGGELGEPIVVPTPLAFIRSVAFSPNGKIVAVGGGAYPGVASQAYGGGMAVLLEVPSARETARLKPSEVVNKPIEFEGVPKNGDGVGRDFLSIFEPSLPLQQFGFASQVLGGQRVRFFRPFRPFRGLQAAGSGGFVVSRDGARG